MTTKNLKKNSLQTTCFSAFSVDPSGQVGWVGCGQWKCPVCAKQNARLWAWRVKLHMNENSAVKWRFWTLTLRPTIKTAKQGYAVLPKLWDKLRKYMARNYGSWSYCAFVEGHPQRGKIPHFHVIASITLGGTHGKRLKDVAFKLGFGYQCKDKRIDTARAAAYVAKYASKGDEDMPKNFRRCRASQDWTKLPDMPPQSIVVQRYGESKFAFVVRACELLNLDYDGVYDQLNKISERRAELQAQNENVDNVNL